MKTALLTLAALLITAGCSDEKPKTAKQNNPLIELQQQTEQKAKDTLNAAVEAQQKALQQAEQN